MTIPRSFSRFTVYFKRNGLWATVQRIGLAVKRTLFSSYMVLFYCDLHTLSLPRVDLPGFLKVEWHKNQTDLSPQDQDAITGFWNPELASRSIKERFELGASLWLIRFENDLAGYGWTLQGRTVEPHYFPLGQNDTQFFDFHVFPKYRGRGMDWYLMTHILHKLALEGGARAYGEAAEWNKASLSSFAMSPFCRLGWGKKFTVLGHTMVCWTRNQGAQQNHELKKTALAATGSKRPSISDLQA